MYIDYCISTLSLNLMVRSMGDGDLVAWLQLERAP